MDKNGREVNKTTFKTPTERSIQVERDFDAPPEVVFDAFVDPEKIEQWWGPAKYSIAVEEVDCRPGGKWRVRHEDPEGNKYVFYGEFREVNRPRVLSRTFEYDGAPGKVSIETARFEQTDSGKTHYVGRDEFNSQEDRDAFTGDGDMEEGASEGFARLDELLGNGQWERQRQTEGTHQAQQYDNLQNRRERQD